MKRGDIVILNLGGNIGKPLPALIIQADILNDDDRLATTIVLPITYELQSMQVVRYKLEPSNKNGLQVSSQVMIDKVMQVDKNRIQKIIGNVAIKHITEIEARLLAILGIN
ncbi:MAG: type II toxin-antitoxin system PemK/MazF family toxin [Neisseriaceae bacterium]|jgi:mRNA interferase MazF